MSAKQDKENKSFVPSPTRPDQWAREVVVNNASNNPVPVSITVSGAVTNNYAESLSVAGLATNTVINYTVPASKIFKVLRIDVSGTNRSVFEVEINASTAAKRRIYFTKYNEVFEFNSLELVANDNIKIIVENKTNSTADFNANLIGILDDA